MNEYNKYHSCPRQCNNSINAIPKLDILTLAGGFGIVPHVVTLARSGGGSEQIEVTVTREHGYRANTILPIGQRSRFI